MKHLKLFEDFRKAETKYELNNEVRKYEQVKDLPLEGEAVINEQFEVLLWITALENMKIKPLNRLEAFKEIGFIAWHSTHYSMRSAMRGDNERESLCKLSKCRVKFSDYFKLTSEFRGHNMRKFGV